MNSRLVSLGFISVREYQRCLDGSFKMLQWEPEERNEVDIAIKKITREMQKGFNHFLDMLDIGDDHDFSESSNKNAQSGLHGTLILYKFSRCWKNKCILSRETRNGKSKHMFKTCGNELPYYPLSLSSLLF